ncbi:MAG TPA: response regulator [Verrucomicrobiae bacterium]|jgi:FOG: CheY-like receiver
MAKQTVLYVEDEENDVFFMRHAFQKAGIEHGLASVADGPDALAYLAGKNPYEDRGQFPVPSLILLDLNLPLISGFEVLQWIRDQPQFRETPVVVFSSSGRPEDRDKAEQLGANNYLLKPASGTQFLDIAKELKQSWLAQRPS